MCVNVYSGPLFYQHEACYAGWMTRDKPQSNPVYQADTVQHKINVTSRSKMAIPVVFDLETNEAVWMDVGLSRNQNWSTNGGNNVASNELSLRDKLEMFVDYDKFSLYDLFRLHVDARGQLVDTPEDADLCFGFEEGMISPEDVDLINSEYMK